MTKKKARQSKKGKRPETSEDEVLRVRLPEEGEVLGLVVQILGGGFLLVRCTDGYMRKVQIPGKFRKRMWCRVGDIISCMPWYGMGEEERGTLVYRYKQNETNWLVQNGYIPEDFVL